MFISMFVLGCSNDDTSSDDYKGHIIFYSDDRFELVKEELTSKNIPYSSNQENELWYPAAYSSDIEKILKNISSKFPAKYELYDEARVGDFKRLLESKGIAYQLVNSDNQGKVFLVDEQNQAVASILFDSVVNGK